MQLEIKDTGVGMTPQIREAVFHIDTYHSTPGTASEKGAGLGLIICRDLALKNNGKMEIQSTPGQGSTFLVTLPPARTRPI
jgi:signal transduction histidine kinase